METPSTTRFAPTESEIGVMVAMWTAGIPSRSSSFTIVAPQRVSVPHVEVRMTPSTFPLISFAISCPNIAALSTGMELPTVT